MCDSEQHDAQMKALSDIEHHLKYHQPDWRIAMISDTQGWTMDYKGYRHVYLWIPGNPLTFNLGDFGTGLVPNQQWINLALPIGLEIKTSGQTNPIEIRLKFTDEVIP